MLLTYLSQQYSAFAPLQLWASDQGRPYHQEQLACRAGTDRCVRLLYKLLRMPQRHIAPTPLPGEFFLQVYLHLAPRASSRPLHMHANELAGLRTGMVHVGILLVEQRLEFSPGSPLMAQGGQPMCPPMAKGM